MAKKTMQAITLTVITMVAMSSAQTSTSTTSTTTTNIGDNTACIQMLFTNFSGLGCTMDKVVKLVREKDDVCKVFKQDFYESCCPSSSPAAQACYENDYFTNVMAFVKATVAKFGQVDVSKCT